MLLAACRVYYWVTNLAHIKLTTLKYYEFFFFLSLSLSLFPLPSLPSFYFLFYLSFATLQMSAPHVSVKSYHKSLGGEVGYFR